MEIDRISIAELNPSLQGSQKVVAGVVTLIWPYSASNKSFSVLIAEPDFRLRRHRGQVRIHFTGPSASAVSRCDPKSGDHVAVRLVGAQWEKDESASQTPGRGIGWQLRFEQRLIIQVQRETQEPFRLDIDHPIPSPQRQFPTSPPLETPSASYSASTKLFAPAMPTHVQAWSTPAFLKRDRLSTTTFFGSDYDPFDEDEFKDNNRKKKTKFGRGSDQWKFTERSSSPESIPEVTTPAVLPSGLDETRDLLVNGHDSVVIQQPDGINTKEHAKSNEEPTLSHDTLGSTGILIQDGAGPSDVHDRFNPSEVSRKTQPTTVDEGVQTVLSGMDSPEYLDQMTEARGAKDAADGSLVSVTPYRDSTDLDAGTVNQQIEVVSVSPTAEIATSLGTSFGGNHDAPVEEEARSQIEPEKGTLNDEPLLNTPVAEEARPQATLEKKSVSPVTVHQSFNENLDDEKDSTKSLPPPEPADNRGSHLLEVENDDGSNFQDLMEDRQDRLFDVSPLIGDNPKTSEIAESVEESIVEPDQAQEPHTGTVDDNSKSDALQIVQEAYVTSPVHQVPFSIVESNTLSVTLPEEAPTSQKIDTFETHQYQESEKISIIPSSSRSLYKTKDLPAPRADTSFSPPKEEPPLSRPSLIDAQNSQEHTETLEILSESGESSSSSTGDQYVDDERQRLPGEMETLEETWALGEGSDSSYEEFEGEESEDEAQDLEDLVEEHDAPAPRTSKVEVIALDDSDEDTGVVGQSQTDGAGISLFSRKKQLSPPADELSLAQNEGQTLKTGSQMSASSVADSQPSPVLQSNENGRTPPVLEHSGYQTSQVGSDGDNLEIADAEPLTSPTKRSSMGDHVDPRLKNRVLTPNDTQPREELSQVSDVSLRSIRDAHDLPTPQLTQNRSFDTLLPATLWPSSVIPASSPPISPSNSPSSPPGNASSNLADQLRKLKDEVRTPREYSPKSHRVSHIPASISPWFAPKKSSGVVPDSQSASEADSEESSGSIDEVELDTADSERNISSSPVEYPTELPISNHTAGRASSLPSQHSFFNQPAPTGLRTFHAYYAPLSTLSSHFNTTISTLSIVLGATSTTQANSGPRDFYSNIFIIDPSLLASKDIASTLPPIASTATAAPGCITASIFRPSRLSLPSALRPGSVILLRSFMVTSSSRAPSLLSTNTSAWAVFNLHSPDPNISGPPVEFGAEERGYVRGLWEWWDQLDPEVKTDVLWSAEMKVKKAVEKAERDRRKGRRLKGMGLRLAPGKEIAVGSHELRDGKEWRDNKETPRGKGGRKGAKGTVRHELRDGKEWIDDK
ncbi:MAG: hypothetical protein Q9219_005751 [cf. Caloplaca sp. 3 TL-2023]